MELYKAQGRVVIETSTGEYAEFGSERGAGVAADGLNRGEVGKEELGWGSPRYVAQGRVVTEEATGNYARFRTAGTARTAAKKLSVGAMQRGEFIWQATRFVVEGKTVIDLAWDRVALFAHEDNAADSADRLNRGAMGAGSLKWVRKSTPDDQAPRYVVDSTDPDSYKVRDTTSSRYAPFGSAGGAEIAAANLNDSGADNSYAWITAATHEELSRKDEPEPELEEWERELLASCGIVEIPEKLYSAEAYTDEVDGRTYGIVRDSSNDTFAPMNSPFDAAMWAQRLNADKMESRKLSWLDGEPSDYFE